MGPGEDDGVGGAGAAGIDEQGRGAALSPAAAGCRIERPACHAVLTGGRPADHDAAIARIRTRKEAARLAGGEPVGMAAIVGSASPWRSAMPPSPPPWSG
jgi:hypothetical protein